MVDATPPSDAELDAVFAALGNTTRRAIVARLGSGDATVSELAEPFAMSLPAVSKHLGVLEDAGLIRRTRHGKTRRCSLRAPALDHAQAWLTDRRDHWTASLDKLADYIEDEDHRA